MEIITGYDVRELRKKCGMSQAAFAKVIGCKKQNIVSIEVKHAGRRIPRWFKEQMEDCEEIADVLNPPKKRKFKLWEWTMSLFNR